MEVSKDGLQKLPLSALSRSEVDPGLLESGPLPDVDLLVPPEVLPATEALAALSAVVGLFPRVHPSVLLQVPSLAEAASALAAGIRLLSRVAPLVDAQVAHTTEGLAANTARVRVAVATWWTHTTHLTVVVVVPSSVARETWTTAEPQAQTQAPTLALG